MVIKLTCLSARIPRRVSDPAADPGPRPGPPRPPRAARLHVLPHHALRPAARRRQGLRRVRAAPRAALPGTPPRAPPEPARPQHRACGRSDALPQHDSNRPRRHTASLCRPRAAPPAIASSNAGPRAPRARPRSGRPARPAQMVYGTDFERDPEAPERCRHCFQGPEEHGADG